MENPPATRMLPTKSSGFCDRVLIIAQITLSDAKRQNTPAKKRTDDDSGIIRQVCACSCQEFMLSAYGEHQCTVPARDGFRPSAEALRLQTESYPGEWPLTISPRCAFGL